MHNHCKLVVNVFLVTFWSYLLLMALKIGCYHKMLHNYML